MPTIWLTAEVPHRAIDFGFFDIEFQHRFSDSEGRFAVSHTLNARMNGLRVEVAHDGADLTGIAFRMQGDAVFMRFTDFAPGSLQADLAQFRQDYLGARDGTVNHLAGSPGTVWNDILADADLVLGTGGNEDARLPGLNFGADTFRMGGGDDTMAGGLGDDRFYGGAGIDWVDYNADGAGFRAVRVDLATGIARDPSGGTDRLSGVEAVTGSRFGDLLLGSDANEMFSGNRGHDTIDGNAGTDTVRFDADYLSGMNDGVWVDLQVATRDDGTIIGQARDGGRGIDRLIDIENVVGTSGFDTIIGSGADNIIAAGSGIDRINGGGGFDIASFAGGRYSSPWTGADVNLALARDQVGNDGYGLTEQLSGIEGVIGTPHADLLAGNAGDNFLAGEAGADTLSGGDGRDTFLFKGGRHLRDADLVFDFVATGSQADILAFDRSRFAGMGDEVRLVNGPSATFAGGQFVYRAASDTLFWDRDGTGPATAQAIVTLRGVDRLTDASFDLI
jgi:Ca2+-binding RTX toxin-like protein